MRKEDGFLMIVTGPVRALRAAQVYLPGKPICSNRRYDHYNGNKYRYSIASSDRNLYKREYAAHQ